MEEKKFWERLYESRHQKLTSSLNQAWYRKALGIIVILLIYLRGICMCLTEWNSLNEYTKLDPCPCSLHLFSVQYFFENTSRVGLVFVICVNIPQPLSWTQPLSTLDSHTVSLSSQPNMSHLIHIVPTTKCQWSSCIHCIVFHFVSITGATDAQSSAPVIVWFDQTQNGKLRPEN